MKLGLFFFLAAQAKPGTTTGDVDLQCPEAAPMSCEDCADMGRDCVRELDVAKACKEFKWDPKKNKCPSIDEEDDDKDDNDQGDENEEEKCPQKPPKKCGQCERIPEHCFDDKMETICEKLGFVDGECPDDDTKPTGGPKPTGDPKPTDDTKPTGDPKPTDETKPKCPNVEEVDECDKCDNIPGMCLKKDKKLKQHCKLLCKDDDDTKPTGDPKPTDKPKPKCPSVDEVDKCDQCDVPENCFRKDKNLKQKCKLLCQDDDDVKPTGEPIKCPKPKSCAHCARADKKCLEKKNFKAKCMDLGLSADGTCEGDDSGDDKCPTKVKKCEQCEKLPENCKTEKLTNQCKRLCADNNDNDDNDNDGSGDGPDELKCPTRKPKTCKLCTKFEKCFVDNQKLQDHCADICAMENGQEIDDKPKCPKEPKTCKACEKADEACFEKDKFADACKELCADDDNDSGVDDNGSGNDDNDDEKPPKCPKEPKTCKACEKAPKACHEQDKFADACRELCEADDSNNEEKPNEA